MRHVWALEIEACAYIVNAFMSFQEYFTRIGTPKLIIGLMILVFYFLSDKT